MSLIREFFDPQPPPVPPDASPYERSVINNIRETVTNTLLSRANLIRTMLDPRVDVKRECGIPKPLTLNHYREMYEGTSAGSRVVSVYPEETFKVQPEIFEDESVETETAFEVRLKEMDANLEGAGSRFVGEGLNSLCDYWQRVDEMSGIGSYGILLLGFDGDLASPVPMTPGGTPKVTRELLYLRALPEYMAGIDSTEKDVGNPRFGQPLVYNVVLSAEASSMTVDRVIPESSTGILPGDIHKVHWSRVIHVADNCKSSNVYGMPRQHQCFDNLHSLYRLYPSSTEMYYKGAFPGIAFESNPAYAGNVTDDASASKDAIEAYMTTMKRYLRLIGFQAKMLAPTVVDPTPQIMANIIGVCLQTGVPLSVFMGHSASGKENSAEEDVDWNDRIKRRQHNHVTPRIIRPTIDRLIDVGVLPSPKQYGVKWPAIISKVEQDRATIGVQRTVALAQYMQHKIYKVMPPTDFLVRIIGLTEKEALSTIKNSQDFVAKLVQELALEAKKGGGTITWVDGIMQLLVPGQPGGDQTGTGTNPNTTAGTQDQTGRGAPSKDRPRGVSGSNN